MGLRHGTPLSSNNNEHDLGMEETEVEEPLFEQEGRELPLQGALVDGRYRVIRLIGEGGFGWVFEVEHELLGRNFAMKILHPRIADDPTWVHRFREEARATATIGHESIIFVTDYGCCPGSGYYFTMELVEGYTLGEILIAQSTMALEDVMNFALAASSALSAVHELGIVHCDLKPGNVMAVNRPNGQIGWKFLDFGTSTFVLKSGDPEFIYGTPAYMAPEQAVGDVVDHRADQFSLACMIYEMSTGKLPWRTEEWRDAFPEVRSRRHLIPVHKIVPEIPAAFHTALARALDMKPSYRWDSVEEFIEALDATVDLSSFEPTVDPMDFKVEQGFGRSLSAPRIRSLDEQSISVQIEGGDELIGCDLAVTISFQTPGRMRREWRRNLFAGGLFVAGEAAPPLYSTVLVELIYTPSAASIALRGSVVARKDDGFGIGFDNSTTDQIRGFVNGLKLGLGVDPSDIVQSSRDVGEGESLSAGEAFVLGRLGVVSVAGRLRGMCSGLPFDYDEVLETLFDRGLIHIQEATGVSEYTEAEPSGVLPAHMDFTTMERDRIGELVDFFISQDNYLAAVNVLENVLQISPDNIELHYRLAKILGEILNDQPGAIEHLKAALSHDSNHGPSKKLLLELSSSSSAS